MITHILSALPTPVPKGPHSVPVSGNTAREDRAFYTIAFVFGCAWLACLVFFDWARDMAKIIPGGLVTGTIIGLAITGISAGLLR